MPPTYPLDPLPLLDALENILWKLNHKTDKGEWVTISNNDATVIQARKLLADRTAAHNQLGLA